MVLLSANFAVLLRSDVVLPVMPVFHCEFTGGTWALVVPGTSWRRPLLKIPLEKQLLLGQLSPSVTIHRSASLLELAWRPSSPIVLLWLGAS